MENWSVSESGRSWGWRRNQPAAGFLSIMGAPCTHWSRKIAKSDEPGKKILYRSGTSKPCSIWGESRVHRDVVDGLCIFSFPYIGSGELPVSFIGNCFPNHHAFSCFWPILLPHANRWRHQWTAETKCHIPRLLPSKLGFSLISVFLQIQVPESWHLGSSLKTCSVPVIFLPAWMDLLCVNVHGYLHGK